MLYHAAGLLPTTAMHEHGAAQKKAGSMPGLHHTGIKNIKSLIYINKKTFLSEETLPKRINDHVLFGHLIPFLHPLCAKNATLHHDNAPGYRHAFHLSDHLD
ncbi:hypothetical protein [Halomonas cerina]|uniref:Uncharacterized protein n=1 Tax=Halomonas cerina TaxID=447424 RepID=A0A839VH79_9GAMM|nr:hypothetical protein [Halomonas cerina]MBB3191974.1 hypothetical protein [Halomonas cerina]